MTVKADSKILSKPLSFLLPIQVQCMCTGSLLLDSFLFTNEFLFQQETLTHQTVRKELLYFFLSVMSLIHPKTFPLHHLMSSVPSPFNADI